MAEQTSLAFDAPAEAAENPRPTVGRAASTMVVPAHHEQDPQFAAAPEGLPHGGDNPEIARLPPSRLDNCSRCLSDCEVAPRQREVFRKIDGTLLCRRCYAREKRR